MKDQEMQIVLPPNPVPGILDPHMEAPNSGVLKMNYCDCDGHNEILVKLEKFDEVQRIDRDAEPHKVLIFITGDPLKVTNVLEKHHKKFEYIEKSPPIPPKPFQVALPPGYGFTGIPLEDLEIDETIVKKTRVCCPKCNHELELKRYDKRFACDGCKEDGFGSRYRCKDCDYSLHKKCKSPKPIISPDLFQPFDFTFCHQPCSTCTRPCYVCGNTIHGYFYRCKSEELDLHLHPCCSNLKPTLSEMHFVPRDKKIPSSSKSTLKPKLSEMHFVPRDKKIPSSSKSMCCENKLRRHSCSYISTCEKYHFHVYCIPKMLHKAWKKGVINVTSPKTMDLQPRKPNNSNRKGGRFGKILKMLSICAGAMVGILLGDPTGLIGGLLTDLFWTMFLPKFPPKLSSK